jgi:hypothetical protein
MDAAKPAIREVVNRIDLKTPHVGLVVFSPKNLSTKHRVYPLNAVVCGRFVSAVQPIRDLRPAAWPLPEERRQRPAGQT